MYKRIRTGLSRHRSRFGLTRPVGSFATFYNDLRASGLQDE